MFNLPLTSRTVLVALLFLGIHPFTNAQAGGDPPSASIFRGGIAGGDDSELMSEAILPATLVHFTAAQTEGGVAVRWQTAYEADVDHFVVECSDDGFSFRPEVRRRAGAGPAESARSYTELLPLPTGPHAYYRLQTVDVDGSWAYSPLVRLVLGQGGWTFKPVANPVRHQELELTWSGEVDAGEMQLTVFSLDGKARLQQSLSAGSGATSRIALPLPPAAYIVTVADARGRHQSRRVVVGR